MAVGERGQQAFHPVGVSFQRGGIGQSIGLSGE
jgi:hypothetical protein